MTDPDRDRGAYTPSDDGPLAFDARDSSIRGVGRPPTTLIISAVILLVLVVALVFYYRSGVRRSGIPPVVGAPLNDIKQAPPTSSQPSDAAAGLQVYSAEQPTPGSTAPPSFAPPPEQPQPRPAAGQGPSPTPTPTPTAPAPAAPAPVAAAPAPAPKPTPAPAPAPPLATPPGATTRAPAMTTRTPTVATRPPVPTPAAGPMVQIGAYSSPALADKGWNDIARTMPGDMVGKTKKVESVIKGSSTLYRAYVGGFASKADATSFCSQLKAVGHVCMVK